MNPFKAGRLRPVFLSLIATLLISFKIQTAWANPELVKAIEGGDIKRIQQLIEEGVDIHENDLCLATKNERPEIIRLLIPHVENFCSCPLLNIAARHGYLDIIKMLIEEYGFDPLLFNTHCPNQGLPLHDAANANRVNVIEYLLNVSPSTINFRQDPVRQQGNTVLQQAFRNTGDYQTIQTLILRGADPRINGSNLIGAAIILNKVDALRLILDYPEFDHNLLNSFDQFGSSLFSLACFYQRTAIVQLFLEDLCFNHSLINTPNNQGQTPLQLAGDNSEIVALLIKNGATPIEQAEAIPQLEELSMDENATVIPETLPTVDPGIDLMDFLLPTSH